MNSSQLKKELQFERIVKLSASNCIFFESLFLSCALISDRTDNALTSCFICVM